MSESLVKKPKRQRRKAARPGEILEAAFQEFSKNGFARTRLEDVATRAGVSKATIYHYFTDKQGLFQSLITEKLLTPLQTNISPDTAAGVTSSDLLKLALNMAYQEGKTSGSLALVRVLLLEPDSLNGFSENPIETVMTKTTALLSSILDRGVSRGEFTKASSDTHALDLLIPILSSIILYGALDGIADFNMDTYTEKQIERLVLSLAV